MSADTPNGGVLGEWRVRSVAGQPVPPGVESTLAFGVNDDGEHRVHGSGGVNRLGGGFELHDDEIAFGPCFTTLMAGPEPAMQYERSLLAAMTGRHMYRVDGDVLTIGSGDNEIVLERAAPRPARTVGHPVEITGTVWYRERIAMPPGALVIVRLQDLSRADAPATVLAEQVIEPQHNVPIPFSLTVDGASIDARHAYAVSARITVDGILRWISADHVTYDPLAPEPLDVLVQRVEQDR